jgi:hypothetical protein
VSHLSDDDSFKRALEILTQTLHEISNFISRFNQPGFSKIPKKIYNAKDKKLEKKINDWNENLSDGKTLLMDLIKIEDHHSLEKLNKKTDDSLLTLEEILKRVVEELNNER